MTATPTLSGQILQRDSGEIPADHYLPATLDAVFWGHLPCASDAAVLSVAPGQTVTVDTVSHGGLLAITVLRATVGLDVVKAPQVADLFGAGIGPVAETRDFLVKGAHARICKADFGG